MLLEAQAASLRLSDAQAASWVPGQHLGCLGSIPEALECWVLLEAQAASWVLGQHPGCLDSIPESLRCSGSIPGAQAASLRLSGAQTASWVLLGAQAASLGMSGAQAASLLECNALTLGPFQLHFAVCLSTLSLVLISPSELPG